MKQSVLRRCAAVVILLSFCALTGACAFADVYKRQVLDRPFSREVVLTGRQPADWMREAADYSTEMRCHRHPYEQGLAARPGIEF